MNKQKKMIFINFHVSKKKRNNNNIMLSLHKLFARID